MQTLYAMDTMEQETVKPGTATSLLNEKLDQTCQIFTYILYTLARVAQYAETDARTRAGKHLPSAEDLAVSTKIAGNDFVFQVLNDKGLLVNLDTWKLRRFEDDDLTRKLYNQLKESETYQTYIAEPARDKASEKHIIEYIFKHILEKNELFRQHMEDSFLHWGDDEDMMGILVGNYLSKPQLFNFLQLISREKIEYARDLLSTVINKRTTAWS